MMTGTRLLAGVARHWPVIVVTALLGLVGGLISAVVATPDYRSESTVLVAIESSGTTADRAQGADYLQQTLPTFTDAVTSSSVLRPVIAELDLHETVADLRERVSADSPADTALITIEAHATSASGARRLASAVTGQFVRTAPGLIAPTAAPSTDGTGTEVQLNGAPAELTLAVVDVSAIPAGRDSPSVPLGLALGLLAGLLVGVGIALVRTALDRRVRTPDEVALITGLPVLGVLPHLADTVWAGRTDDREWQLAIRGIRSALSPRGEAQRIVQFTAAISGEGTTTIVADVAKALDRAGIRVTAVDGDIEQGDLADVVGTEATGPGLVETIAAVPPRRQTAARAHGGLSVVPASADAGMSASEAADLLASDGMAEAIGVLSEGSGMVLIDAPALDRSADSLALSRTATEVVIVVTMGSVSSPALEALLERMQAAGATVAGVILRTSVDRPVSVLALAGRRAP